MSVNRYPQLVGAWDRCLIGFGDLGSDPSTRGYYIFGKCDAQSLSFQSEEQGMGGGGLLFPAMRPAGRFFQWASHPEQT